MVPAGRVARVAGRTLHGCARLSAEGARLVPLRSARVASKAIPMSSHDALSSSYFPSQFNMAPQRRFHTGWSNHSPLLKFPSPHLLTVIAA
jgi:hypothetical protein